ncbi:hypothetical protein B6N60_02325 [Richelia sinica FACHB-800]|uniref:Uncharacterized protein n=1 Tax=Richelia sinica FACHB-800 TaxID=1357546 RepID=A0A975T7S4_9NOST|nr:hypothetical protein B6N60_02325 [Richelia sinica FACHB-800]
MKTINDSSGLIILAQKTIISTDEFQQLLNDIPVES